MSGKAWPFATSYRLRPLLTQRKDHNVFALTAACNFLKLADGVIGTAIAPGRLSGFCLRQISHQQFSVRKSFDLQPIERSHMSVQGFHGVENENIEEIAQRRPEFGFGPQPFPQPAKQLVTSLLDLVDRES